MTPCVGAQKLDKATEPQVIPDKYKLNKEPWNPWSGDWGLGLVGLKKKTQMSLSYGARAPEAEP